MWTQQEKSSSVWNSTLNTKHAKCVVLQWFLVAHLTIFPSTSPLYFLYTVSSCIIRMITLKIANMAKACRRSWKIYVFLIHEFVYLVGCIIWYHWIIKQIYIYIYIYYKIILHLLLQHRLYKNRVLWIHNKVYTHTHKPKDLNTIRRLRWSSG
jgi:hypothetical protein